MLTLPADVARCRGRIWGEDDFPVAPECQTCERLVAHYFHEMSDGIVAHQNPPTERDCPLRLPVDDGVNQLGKLWMELRAAIRAEPKEQQNG